MNILRCIGLLSLLILILGAGCDTPIGSSQSASNQATPPQQSWSAPITTPQTGNSGGYYYSFWTNGVGAASMALGSGGSYKVDWNNQVSGSFGDFTAGLGWFPGNEKPVTYSGSYVNSGGGACGVYGWTTSPLVEYYIVESSGAGGGPGQGTHVGTVYSDGSYYDIYEHQQVNQPSIAGTATFQQYISVRQTPRVGGTVTVKNHFDAWKNLGLNLGTMNYEILLTEGWNGSGSSNLSLGQNN